jgi:ABC-2 type transport system permease protein
VIQFRLFIREPIALFFSFAFPVLMVLLFGSIFRQEGYAGFITSGMIAVTVMSTGLFTIGAGVVQDRRLGVFKRLRATPLKTEVLIISYMLTLYATILLSTALLIVTSRLVFQVKVEGSYFHLFVAVTLGTLAFIAIGSIIASSCKTPRAANAVAQILLYPLMFLSGSFWPLEMMPQFLQKIAEVLPTTYLVETIRSIIVQGLGLGDNLTNLLVLVGWMAVGLAVSAKMFRWE